MEAHKDYVDQVFSTFRTTGHASRLFIKESRVKAVFISKEPMPTNIQSVDCGWELENNISKLQGFYVGEKISTRLSKRHLGNHLEKCLKDTWLNPYLIPVRVAIANQLITNTLFYTVQL